MLTELLNKLMEQKIMGASDILDFMKKEYGADEAAALIKLNILLML